jgi:CIC family chloride channel protein
MPKSPNFRFFQGGLLKHRATPLFYTTRYDYMILIGLSGIIGGVVGLVISLFEQAIQLIGAFRLDLFAGSELNPVLVVAGAALVGAAMTAFGFWLTARFAPEAAGSGIPHLEGALDGLHHIRWRRVLPIKFIAGAFTISSGMILGREGPSIQIGGSVGNMFAGSAKRYQHATHILTASGAAAGLAAAFNAPLAGILFVIEEMRPQFRYNITSFKCVTVASAVATIVMRALHGQDAVMDVPHFDVPSLVSLSFFLFLGIIFGIVGVYFNKWILYTTDKVSQMQASKVSRVVITGALFGAVFAMLQQFSPSLTGGGIELITELFLHPTTWGILLLIFALRLFATIACFASAAPGGVFAPMLALGTLLGLAYGNFMAIYFPDLIPQPGIFAIAGMGALFAATVRAPVTGIILVVEMTDNYQLILPLLVTCMGATLIAQILKGKPLYSELLKQSLRNNPEIKRQANEAKEAKEES